MPAASGSGDGRRDARNDLDSDPCMSQREHLFRAAAEHEGVSAFQPHDSFALPGRTDHEPVDGVLFDARPPGALADAEALCACQTAKCLGIDEGIVQNQIGLLDAPQRANRPQLRVTGAGSDQRHSTYGHSFTPTSRPSG